MEGFEILRTTENPKSPDGECRALALRESPVGTPISREVGLQDLCEKDFDLVLTDLLAVLEKAKEPNPETMAILMLMINGRLTPTTPALRLDGQDYLFKPFELTELGMWVAKCVEKLERRRRNFQADPEEGKRNEKILNILKMMSHDIRGSLVSISATLKLLGRGYYGKMDEGVANRLKDLLSRTMGLIGITEEYLGRTFSVQDEVEMEGEAVDLMQDIIGPVLKEFAAELKDHRLLIDHSLKAIASERISVRVSRIWLKTVFRNLLKNAIQYGDKDGTIALGFEDHGSSYRLNVFNSGKPIPEECRENLFSQFKGLSNGRQGNGRGDGLGLGLYLIKKIIQKQGGDIWYEAKEDGSNFVFTLPRG